jgi:hypothetical protein
MMFAADDVTIEVAADRAIPSAPQQPWTPGFLAWWPRTFERPDAKAAKYTIALSELRELTADERSNAESEKQIAAIEQEWEAAIDLWWACVSRDQGEVIAAALALWRRCELATW